MNNNNLCGIMISQNSKIVHKNNFQIEIHNGNVAVYIHECNYDPNKIKIAVHIIDTFKNKIEKNKNDNATIHIDKDILEKINREFQLFNNKKRQHIAEIKNMYDTLTKSAEDMEMDALDELLESQGLLTNVKKYICGNCPRTFKTQKGLDTHERLCSYNQESKGIKCEHCDEIAKTIKGLKSHYRKKHNMELKDDTSLDCCSDSSN
jgi:DNA-directed RNA polymerase subunit RPC12/RpoP